MDQKEKYNNRTAIIWNAIHFQSDKPILTGIKADKRYEKAKEDVAIIQLLRIVKDVINKGQFGAQHDELAISLAQCRNFLPSYQGKRSIATFTAMLVEYYEMQIEHFGKLAFGENLMLEIIAACKGEALSNITLKTYYESDEKEKTKWEDKYKNI